MKYTKKMVLVPYQDGAGDPFEGEKPKKSSIRQYAMERQHKLITMILKIALAKGYDFDGKFKTSDGESLDIVPLLMHAASPGRDIKGLDEFVDLLHACNVTPDLIINVNVRDALLKRYTARRRTSSRPPPPPPPPTPPPPVEEQEAREDEDNTLFPPELSLSQEEIPPPRVQNKRKCTTDTNDRAHKVQKGTIWDADDSDLD